MRIIAGDRVVDGIGSHSETERILRRASKAGLRIHRLEIVDLARRWEDHLGPDEFKSGASAMAAIEKARKLLNKKKADLVVIEGRDDLKTGYGKADREKYMQLYEKKLTPLEGYNRLVPLFLRHHEISESEYFLVRDALFRNYAKTWKGKLPDERWFRPLTKFFRGVDCANPNVDYSGRIILASGKTGAELGVPAKKSVEVMGNAFTKLTVDGIKSLPKIAPYMHLRRTIRKALTEADIDFNKAFLKKNALIDAYTCYPVVPMGLLLQMDLVKDFSELPEFLENYEVTVTGGLNLGKAAWNLTSLNALIIMRQRLISSRKFRYGLVHGNGSLGNQQGITILQRLN